MTRPAPRHAFALAGLLLLGAAAWSDRDLVTLVRDQVADARAHGQVSHPVDASTRSIDDEALMHLAGLPPHLAARQRAERALLELQAAEETFRAALEAAHDEHPAARLHDGTWGDSPFADLDAVGWGPYDAARAANLPAYAAAVEVCVGELEAAAAADPGNGVYAALASLLELDLCYRPSPLDPYFAWESSLEPVAARIEVVDTEGFAASMTALERALAAERFTLESPELLEARAASEAGPGTSAQLRRLSAALTSYMPELMLFKHRGATGLSALATRERLQGRSGERLLQVARGIALRLGAEGTSIITVLVGQSSLGQVDTAWLSDAVSRQDTTRALAAQDEMLGLQRARASSLRRETPYHQLGVLDALLTPAGGWGAGWSPRLGRMHDYAFVEGAALWALSLLLVGWMVRLAFQARGAAPTQPIAPWTLGDLLGVVLPGVGAAAALVLLYCRLHPVSGYGVSVATPVAIGVSLALAGVGAFTTAWLLRARVLAKAGLDFARPRAARLGLALVVGSTLGALTWLGPFHMQLAPLWLALAATGMALALRGGWRVGGEDFAGLTRYHGRVGLACVGASLALTAGLNLAFVSGRRAALTEALVDQTLSRVVREARVWGNGELQDAFRQLVEECPQRPLGWDERPH